MDTLYRNFRVVDQSLVSKNKFLSSILQSSLMDQKQIFSLWRQAKYFFFQIIIFR